MIVHRNAHISPRACIHLLCFILGVPPRKFSAAGVMGGTQSVLLHFPEHTARKDRDDKESWEAVLLCIEHMHSGGDG